MEKLSAKRVLAISLIALLFSGSLCNLHTALTPLEDISVKSAVLEWFDALPFRIPFVELNGIYERLLGKRFVRDAEPQYNVAKLENGYITFVNPRYDQAENAARLDAFSNEARKRGINFLYIQAPFKVDKYDPQLPPYVSDYSNENADELLSLLTAAPTLDLRDEIYRDGLSHYDLFFRTDHHWTPEAALWAARCVAQRLNLLYGYQFDPEALAMEHYRQVVLEQSYLGSQGKRVGQYYAGVDDFTAVLPKKEPQQYEVFVPTVQYQAQGTFSQVLYHAELGASTDLYNGNNYQAYLALGDGTGLQEIKNDSNPQGPKLILFRDSFASAMVPFLAQYFSEIDLIDFRYYTPEDLTIYIEAKAPDLIMVMYNPDLLGWGIPFRFNCWES